MCSWPKNRSHLPFIKTDVHLWYLSHSCFSTIHIVQLYIALCTSLVGAFSQQKWHQIGSSSLNSKGAEPQARHEVSRLQSSWKPNPTPSPVATRETFGGHPHHIESHPQSEWNSCDRHQPRCHLCPWCTNWIPSKTMGSFSHKIRELWKASTLKLHLMKTNKRSEKKQHQKDKSNEVQADKSSGVQVSLVLLGLFWGCFGWGVG